MRKISYIFNSNMYRRVVSICFIIGAVTLILSLYVKRVSTSRECLYEYYNNIPPNTIDVLCVGSSHTYCGINPVVMFKEYGIAAFDLAAGFQPIWCSYYYIEEALKKQNPQCIILDIYTACFEPETFENTVQMNLNGMRLSDTKWKALTAYTCDQKLDIFLEFPISHANYEKISAKDYYINPERYLGYYYNNNIAQLNNINSERDMILSISDKLAIPLKSEEWLVKIIELCREEEIDLILVNAPIPNYNESLQKNVNYISEIANKYDVPILDGCVNYSQIGIDYTVDSMDDNHINYYGSVKYTKWICKYLIDNFELPNRCSDKKYKYWCKSCESLENKINEQIIYNEPNLIQTLKNLRQSNSYMYAIICSGNGGGGVTFKDNNNEAYSYLKTEGIDLNAPCIYLFDENRLIYSAKDDSEYYYYLPTDVLEFSITEDMINYKINNEVIKSISVLDEGTDIYFICYNKVLNDIMYFNFLETNGYKKSY